MTPNLVSVRCGKIAPLGPEGILSGFVKSAVVGVVAVKELGLEGDAQADLSVHGGPDKAVYAYADGHYPAWAADLPPYVGKFVPGGFGENLTIAGMDESMLCVGDVHAIGNVVLQVCQPRRPCLKLALYFDDIHMPRAMVRSGRSGWYYRVLQTGAIRAGDVVKLEARPHPDFAFTRLLAIVSHGGASKDELRRMIAMDGLAQQWRAQAGRALQES